MRVLARLLLLLLVVLLVAPLAAALVALEPAPRVEAVERLSQEEIRRARQLMEEHDPRRLEAGEIRSLSLADREINLLLRYALGRLLPLTARTALGDGRLGIEATLTVPENPFGRYLNVAAEAGLAAGRPYLDSLRFGDVDVPAPLANLLLAGAHRLLSGNDLYRRSLAAVNGVRIDPGRLRLVYQWQPELIREARAAGRSLMVAAGEEDRLLAYHGGLVEATARQRRGARVALPELMEPLFTLAAERSAADRDPVKENRSLITVLALHVQGASVPRLLGAPAAAGEETAVPLLRGRHDLAQHFLISAGVAVLGGTALADAVGLLKEVDDARHGSGFSFTDLAADRAGVRFAEQATASPAAARRLQAALAEGVTDAVLLPSLDGLDEFMPQAVFQERYGGVGAPAYRRVARTIEERIAALPLYRR